MPSCLSSATIGANAGTGQKTYYMGHFSHPKATTEPFPISGWPSNLTQLLNMAIYSELSHYKLMIVHRYVSLPEELPFPFLAGSQIFVAAASLFVSYGPSDFFSATISRGQPRDLHLGQRRGPFSLLRAPGGLCILA